MYCTAYKILQSGNCLFTLAAASKTLASSPFSIFTSLRAKHKKKITQFIRKWSLRAEMKRKCHLHSSGNVSAMHVKHRLNMDSDLQSLFGLHVHNCTHWLRPPQTHHLTFPHLGSYTRTLLVSQERRRIL
jgi:hypothetical protein